jgi:catechol 2,3-dioxygenase-like lactoylglutathione lyase family enzyme
VPGVIEGIHHVQVAAPPGSEEEARRFFSGVLGLEELPKPEPLAARGGAWFSCGGAMQLHVGIAEDFTPAHKAHPAFVVDGAERLTALAARLGGAGIEVTWDQALAGTSRFYASDPWGNRLEFTTA